MNLWLDELAAHGDEILGLHPASDGAWCALVVEDGVPTPWCIERDGERRTLAARRRARRAATAVRRGALSDDLDRHLRAHPGEPIPILVWARFQPPLREDGQAIDVRGAQADLSDLCRGLADCEPATTPSLPAVAMVAAEPALRALAYHPRVGAIDHLDPALRVTADAGGEATLECVRVDDAVASYPAATGAGLVVAALEGSMPSAAAQALINPVIDTNAPAGVEGFHAGRVLSVIKGDSQGSGTPRLIDGPLPALTWRSAAPAPSASHAWMPATASWASPASIRSANTQMPLVSFSA